MQIAGFHTSCFLLLYTCSDRFLEAALRVIYVFYMFAIWACEESALMTRASCTRLGVRWACFIDMAR